MHTIRIGMLWVVVGLVSCVGGGEGNGGGAQCARVERKLRSCNLLTPGEFQDCDEPETPFRQCRFDCAVNAPCDELAVLFCQDTEAPGLMACEQRCLEQHSFTCANGELIREDWHCDGGADCADGSDEVGCMTETFTCDNGSVVQASSECNGFNDCADGSDESSCPTFQCENGTVIPLEYRCDAWPDCADASDEINGCPTFQCADGPLVPEQFKCNGDLDCVDGSDESGCPAEAEPICN